MWGEKLIRSAAGKLGKGIQTVGTALGRPQSTIGLASSLQSYGGNKSGQGFVLVKPAYADSGVKGTSTSSSYPEFSKVEPGAYSSIQGYGSGGGSPSYAPSSGGQAPGAGDGGGGSYDGGGEQSYDSYMQSLRDAWSGARGALEGIIPTYDADFTNFKTNVGKYVEDARTGLQEQIGDIGYRFGESLRGLNKTSKELADRTRSTFSGLGTLDSSAFQDEALKREQADKEGISSLTVARDRDTSAAEREFATYEREQQNKINTYEQEINRAKQGIRQAIANVNLDEAQSLINYTNQLRSEQQQAAQQMMAIKTNLAMAQAQGTDVIGNLRKIGSSNLNFNNLFGQGLQGRLASGRSRFNIPSGGVVGSGFIGGDTSVDDPRRRLFA